MDSDRSCSRSELGVVYLIFLSGNEAISEVLTMLLLLVCSNRHSKSREFSSDSMKYEVVTILSKVKIRSQEQVEDLDANENPEVQNVNYHHASAPGMSQSQAEGDAGDSNEQAAAQPYHRDHRKIGRNEPCYCGSGKKYKHCHGKLS